MKKVSLYDLVLENNMDIMKDLNEIIERALNAEPRINFPNYEIPRFYWRGYNQPSDIINNLLSNAEFLAQAHLDKIMRIGFEKYLESESLFIRYFLTNEELIVLQETPKEAYSSKWIVSILIRAFINFRLKLIIVDKELFANYNYFDNQGNKNFKKWEDKLKELEFDNLEEFKALYYFYHRVIRDEDMKTIPENAPDNIKYGITKAYEYAKQGEVIVKKYGLPLPKSLIEKDKNSID